MGVVGDRGLDFYDADIGETLVVALTGASAQTSDAQGALSPGRWLVQVVDPTNRTWIRFGPFVAAGTLTAVAAQGPQRIPIDPDGMVRAFEILIRPNHNDRVAGIVESGGTATLWLTKISRAIKR